MALAHWKHPDTGTVDYVQPLAPGANYQNPARLHLANYTTNYNHRGFNGPQNLGAYLLLQGWTLGTFTDSRRGCGLEKLHFRLVCGHPGRLCPANGATVIFGKIQQLRPGFQINARWTIVQKFGIIGAGSHTDYCVPAAELF
jgi:hypothetical protein